MKKKNLISEIKKAIKNYGWLNSATLNWDSDIIFNSMGNHCQLIDTLKSDSVGVTEYIHEQETATFSVNYSDLSKNILMEIYHRIQEMELYEIETLIANKTV